MESLSRDSVRALRFYLQSTSCLKQKYNHFGVALAESLEALGQEVVESVWASFVETARHAPINITAAFLQGRDSNHEPQHPPSRLAEAEAEVAHVFANACKNLRTASNTHAVLGTLVRQAHVDNDGQIISNVLFHW